MIFLKVVRIAIASLLINRLRAVLLRLEHQWGRGSHRLNDFGTAVSKLISPPNFNDGT